MPAQRQRRTPAKAPAATKRAAAPPARPQADQPEGRRVFVLGAGVDVSYGVPTMSTLVRDLAAFTKGDGAPIHEALKKKLPRLRFSFERHAGDQGQVMVRQLLSSDNEDLLAILESTATELKADPEAAGIGVLLERLCRFGEINQMTGEDATSIARFAGVNTDVSGGEPIFDPEHAILTPTTAQGLRQAFVRALQGETFDDKQRERMQYFVEVTSNVEELMSLYFMKYSLGRAADQKSFLYIVWMLWAFLRLKSTGRPRRDQSLYARLPTLCNDVITFNYTNFFDRQILKRVRFFHGDLDHYLRVDTRELVGGTPELAAATTVEGIVALINHLRLDVKDAPALDIPALVPPTSFKPLMSRQQLKVWSDTDDAIERAAVAVIVGYSFAMADEHFNDLLRHSNPLLRVIVINPDLTTASKEACRILGIDPASLVSETRGKVEVRRTGRLTCAGAKADEVTAELLKALG